MATKRVFLGNIKGPKGDSCVLTEEDIQMMVEMIREDVTPEEWVFTDRDENDVRRMVYTNPISEEIWRFTLDDGSVIEKGVDVK